MNTFSISPKPGASKLIGSPLGVPYQDKSNVARWRHTRGSDLRCRGNTWFIPYETIQSRAKERPHPATFPVQLAEWCIKLHGVSRVQTMLDPFLGIGNSAVAAQRCGVKNLLDSKSTRPIWRKPAAGLGFSLKDSAWSSRGAKTAR